MTEHDDPVDTAMDRLKPIFSQLTFGSIMGFSSGYAMKKVGKAVAVVVGMGFVALQGAAYAGYIDVNWDKLKESTKQKLDTTGDGKLDKEDAKAYWRKLKNILTYNIGSSTGFSLGFLYGVKSG